MLLETNSLLVKFTVFFINCECKTFSLNIPVYSYNVSFQYFLQREDFLAKKIHAVSRNLHLSLKQGAYNVYLYTSLLLIWNTE